MRGINAFLDRILFWATAFSAMAFFVVVIVSIAARSTALWPFHSSVELSRLLFVWSCFLAAALTYRKQAHVGFTLLFERMPLTWQRCIALLNYALILTFMGIVFVQAVLTCRLLWPTVLPILGISQAWFYVPVPVACLFMFSYTLEFITRLWKPAAGEDAA